MSKRQRAQIELEVVSSEARLNLTRLLRAATRADEPPIGLIRQNAAVNTANAVLNRPIYVLESDDWGDYQSAEYGWHQGEVELVMRRPGTAALIETLADLIVARQLDASDVNEILDADRCGVRFHMSDEVVTIDVVDVPDVPEGSPPQEHSNVRRLFERMDRAMQDQDWSLVLHTGASIFETLAKLVVSVPSVQGQSLGSWFDLYRKHSKLAVPLLDTIQAIFRQRNIEPLAGHGSPQDPAITRDDAIYISHLTRTLVRLERELSNPSPTAP